jgi:hypothetical protein
LLRANILKLLNGKIDSEQIKEKLKSIDFDEREQNSMEKISSARFQNFRVILLAIWILSNYGFIYFITDEESNPFIVRIYFTVLFSVLMLSVALRGIGSLLYLIFRRRE